MKKTLLVVGLTTLVSTTAMAAQYGAAGCGLGSMVWENKNGMVNQILAATTNGTSGSQTFGITTGTSNCDTKGTMANVKAYVEANRVALANDIARGQGETLTALTEVYGCSYDSTVGSTLQKNYKSIFPSEAVSAEEITATLNKVMPAACGNI